MDILIRIVNRYPFFMRTHLTVHDIDRAFQEIENRNKKLFKKISKRKIKLKKYGIK